jgi:hypothetical protein
VKPPTAEPIEAAATLCREHPQVARDEHITAVPTLVKQLPLPLRRLICDLTDQERVP